MDIGDLRGRECEPLVLSLLAHAQIHRHERDAIERAPAIAAEYAEQANRRLWGLWHEREEAVLGVIGIEDHGDGAGIIRDLAVSPGFRGRGVGQALIEYVQQRFASLSGDTMAEAAGFYRHCGFALSASGSLPDGRQALRFSWPEPLAASWDSSLTTT